MKITIKEIEAIIERLDDSDYDVRNYLEETLVKIGDASIEPLIKSLEHEKTEIRMESARVLGRIGDKRAIKPLIRALNDENPDFRKEAALAINKIVDKRL